MKKSLPIAGLMLALATSLAAAEGLNLAWNDCGTNGASSASFACNSNTGTTFPMFASFVPPPGMAEFLGISSQIDISSTSPTLPDWWQHGTGTCRGTTGMSVGFDFTAGPTGCVDPWFGQAAGGFGYDSGFQSPNRARMRVQCAIPFENRGPIDENTEYYAYRVNLGRAKTTGTGSCAGCLEPACIVLNEIQLFQPPEFANDPVITNPLNAQHVTWQAPAVPNCPQGTSSTTRTWGQVKSLYR